MKSRPDKQNQQKPRTYQTTIHKAPIAPYLYTGMKA